jgi:hypothetical protein
MFPLPPGADRPNARGDQRGDGCLEHGVENSGSSEECTQIDEVNGWIAASGQSEPCSQRFLGQALN